MATLQEYLEQDKEKLLADLQQAKSPEKTQEVLGRELDRMLIRYNEDCAVPEVRDAAAYMLQTARNAVPLVDTLGETKIWEETGTSLAESASSGSGSGNEKKRSVFAGPTVIFGMGGIICGIIALVMSSSAAADKIVFPSQPMAWILFFAGAVCVALAGRFSVGKQEGKVQPRGRQQAEVMVDPQKAYRALRTVAITADRNLSEVQSSVAWQKRKTEETAGGKAGEADIDTAQLDLYAGLLEAYASGDGQFALDKLADVKYYLHRHDIEAVDYSEKTESYFDVMPSSRPGTLRPALVRNGKLLKKGLAAR